jgi:regulator of sirC expression with transglutaminase-like and TPR domain
VNKAEIRRVAVHISLATLATNRRAITLPIERIQRRIDRLLDQIEAAADQEDWETTLRLSEQVLDLDPDDEDAQTFVRLAQRRVNPGADSADDDSESTE